jgi:hypothetical protein
LQCGERACAAFVGLGDVSQFDHHERRVRLNL